MEWYFIVLLSIFIGFIDCDKQQKQKDCMAFSDVGFIVDSSTSLVQQYNEEKDIIKILARKLNVSENGTHASLVVFSEFASLQIPFSASNAPKDFDAQVDLLPFLDSTTRIDRALNVSYHEMFQEKNGLRPGSNKVLILLTDGEQTKDADAVPPSQAIKPIYSLGVSVIVIGIGSRVKHAESELRSMIQGNGALFFAANFDELKLDSFLEKIVFASRVGCLVEVPRCGSFRDIGFVIDSSGSLRDDFQKEKEFIKILADAFSLSKSGPRGGLISFSDVARINLRFSEFTTLEKFKNTVEKLPLMGTITRIDLGLELALSDLFADNNGRANRTDKLLFLLTDGSQIPEPGATEPSIIAKTIRDSGIELVIIGIGEGISMYELNRIAGAKSKIYSAKSFNDLRSLDFVTRIVSQFCKKNETISQMKRCERTDVGFLVDTSESLEYDFPQRREFIKLLAEQFNINSRATRAALIAFSTNPRLVIKFGDKVSQQTFVSRVNLLPINGKVARLDTALSLATSQLYQVKNGMRLHSSKILIILTSGEVTKNSDQDLLRQVTKPLHNAGIRIIVIVVGIRTSAEDFNRIVKRSSDVVVIKNINAISLDAFAESARSIACKGNAQVQTCSRIADLAFVLDSSTSMRETFQSEKNFAKEIADVFKISPNKTHVALVVFSDIAERIVAFSDLTDLTRFKYSIDQLRLIDSVTRIDLALDVADRDVFTTEAGVRKGVPSILILITDGSQTKDYPHKDPSKIAERLRNRGIQLIIVGIGDYVKRDELLKLAGDENKLFLAKSNAEFSSLEFVRKLTDASCKYAASNTDYRRVP